MGGRIHAELVKMLTPDVYEMTYAKWRLGELVACTHGTELFEDACSSSIVPNNAYSIPG